MYKVASRASYDDNRTFVREHVLVAERKIGHKLEHGEVVHHIDGNKMNNDPDNLMIFASNADHSAFHKGAPIYQENDVWRAVRKDKHYVCENCGKTFVAKYCRQNKHVFCSYECSYEAKLHLHLTKDMLINLIIANKGNMVAVGKTLEISDNAVRKYCKKFGLPTHSMEYRHGALAQLEERLVCNQ